MKQDNSMAGIPYGPADAIEMSSGGYTAVVVPHVGANLISLKNESMGLDILRTPPSYEELIKNSVIYGIPLLFFPNRITGGRIQRDGFDISLPINDPTGTMHIHGFLHSRPWTVEKCTCGQVCTVKCVFRNNKNTDFYKYFPFDFRATVTYKLSSEGLGQDFEMVNTGKGPMPFGFGYHTAFRIPFSGNGNAKTCMFKASVAQRWEIRDDSIPTGRFAGDIDTVKTLREKGIRANGERMVKMCFSSKPYDIDGQPSNRAVLYDPGCSEQVIYEADTGFRHWVIWNDDGNSGFLCIEPQTWISNAPNLDMDTSLSGYRILDSGASVKLRNRLFIKNT